MATWRLALPASAAGIAMSEQPLPLPDIGTTIEDGPVVVTVAYRVRSEDLAGFLEAAGGLRRSRRRTGATHWHLHRDLADPELFEEMFVVGSWAEHERQHERLQGRERDAMEAVDAFLAPGTSRTARHAVGVRPPGPHRL